MGLGLIFVQLYVLKIQLPLASFFLFFFCLFSSLQASLSIPPHGESRLAALLSCTPLFYTEALGCGGKVLEK